MCFLLYYQSSHATCRTRHITMYLWATFHLYVGMTASHLGCSHALGWPCRNLTTTTAELRIIRNSLNFPLNLTFRLKHREINAFLWNTKFNFFFSSWSLAQLELSPCRFLSFTAFWEFSSDTQVLENLWRSVSEQVQEQNSHIFLKDTASSTHSPVTLPIKTPLTRE